MFLYEKLMIKLDFKPRVCYFHLKIKNTSSPPTCTILTLFLHRVSLLEGAAVLAWEKSFIKLYKLIPNLDNIIFFRENNNVST